MRALILKDAYTFEYIERPLPVRAPGQVLFKVDAVCVCGSDIKTVKGNLVNYELPRVLGHEAAGTVVEADPDSGFVPGDKVCLMPCIACGDCIACRAGKPNCCAKLNLYGVHTDGALQEYMCVSPENLCKVPDEFSAMETALVEPLTIGAHAVEKLHISEGDRVLIIGAGVIGVSCALQVMLGGGSVCMLNRSEERADFVRRTFSMPCLLLSDPELKYKLDDITGGEGFHAVIDTTGSPEIMQSAYRYLGQGGSLVFLAMTHDPVSFPERDFHMKEPTLYTSRNSVPANYRDVIRSCSDGLLDGRAMITHQASFENAGEMIVRWVKGEPGYFKGLITF